MALRKLKTLDNGSAGDYWRIINATFSRETLTVTCRLALYTNQTIADSTNKHLGLVKYFSFTVTSADLNSDIRALIYDKIKVLTNSTVTIDLLGNQITPRAYDSDLADATDV